MSDGKVVALSVVEWKAEAVPEVVETLRDLLERAQRGEVRAVAGTYVLEEPDRIHVRTFITRDGETGMTVVLGGITSLSHRIASELNAERADDA
jgi:hypothetical protein